MRGYIQLPKNGQRMNEMARSWIVEKGQERSTYPSRLVTSGCKKLLMTYIKEHSKNRIATVRIILLVGQMQPPLQGHIPKPSNACYLRRDLNRNTLDGFPFGVVDIIRTCRISTIGDVHARARMCGRIPA